MGFKDGKLTRAEFANFFKKFNTRQEMEVIYNKYKQISFIYTLFYISMHVSCNVYKNTFLRYRDENKSEWTPAELMLFLEDEQLVNTNIFVSL